MLYYIYMSLLDSVKNILSSAKQTFATPGEEILGIDIGSTSVKIVELHKKSGHVELFNYGEVALGPYDKKAIGDMAHLDTVTLSEAINYLLKVSTMQTRAAIIGVPATQSLVFLLTLPNAARSNLAAVIPNEARKFIPVSLSEVVLDWLPLPFSLSETADTFQVLVAATRAEALAALREVAEKTGLIVYGYELEIFAQIRALLQNEISSVLLVDVGAIKTRASVVRQGVVYSSRMLSFGAHGITNALARSMNIDFARAEDIKKQNGLTGGDTQVRNIIEPYILQLVTELQSVLRQYETEYSTTIEKIMFLGGGVRMNGFIEFVSEKLAPVKCNRSNAFSAVAKPRFLDTVVDAIDPVFATSLGLAERHFDE